MLLSHQCLVNQCTYALVDLTWFADDRGRAIDCFFACSWNSQEVTEFRTVNRWGMTMTYHQANEGAQVQVHAPYLHHVFKHGFQ